MPETRHYIALQGDARVTFKVGPGPAESFKYGPRESVPFGATLAYPVSPEIAAEWVADDDDRSEV